MPLPSAARMLAGQYASVSGNCLSQTKDTLARLRIFAICGPDLINVLLSDMGHVVQRSVPDPPHGALLDVHRVPVQRMLLPVLECLWLRLGCIGDELLVSGPHLNHS